MKVAIVGTRKIKDHVEYDVMGTYGAEKMLERIAKQHAHDQILIGDCTGIDALAIQACIKATANPNQIEVFTIGDEKGKGLTYSSARREITLAKKSGCQIHYLAGGDLDRHIKVRLRDRTKAVISQAETVIAFVQGGWDTNPGSWMAVQDAIRHNIPVYIFPLIYPLYRFEDLPEKVQNLPDFCGSWVRASNDPLSVWGYSFRYEAPKNPPPHPRIEARIGGHLTKLGYLQANKQIKGAIHQECVTLVHGDWYTGIESSHEPTYCALVWNEKFTTRAGDRIARGSRFKGNDGEWISLIEVNGEKFRSPAFFWTYWRDNGNQYDIDGSEDHIRMAEDREEWRKDGERWVWNGEFKTPTEYEWQLSDDLTLSVEDDTGDPGFTSEAMLKSFTQMQRLDWEWDGYECSGGIVFEKHDNLSIRQDPDDALVATARYLKTRTTIEKADDAFRVARWLINVVGNDEREINRWVGYLQGKGRIEYGEPATAREACEMLKYLSNELDELNAPEEDAIERFQRETYTEIVSGEVNEEKAALMQAGARHGLTWEDLQTPPAFSHLTYEDDPEPSFSAYTYHRVGFPNQ